MPKILVIDQDQDLLKDVCDWLENQYSTVEVASSSGAGQKLLVKHVYDVIVLDWHLVSPNSIEVCKWYRTRSGNSPILVLLNEDDDVEEVISALAVGADDCIRKPFALRELTVRINALRRRNVNAFSTVIQQGPLKLDPSRHIATIDNRELNLTATEFDLLEYIARHHTNVLSATVLLNNVWKDAAMSTSVDTVRAYVKRLRQKLEAVGYRDLIENVHGVGYRMNSGVQASAVVPGHLVAQPVGSFAAV